MPNKLDVAIEAAKKGAEKVLQYFNTNPSFDLKPDHTPVTIADKESEEAIKKTILASFPHALFVGEETGGSIDQGTFWVIDPLDSTKNFIRGLPFWAIEIAYIDQGEPIVGISYAPVLNELLYAEKGKGAFLNDKKVSVSKITNIEDAFLNHGTLAYYEEKLPNLIDLAHQVFRQRGFGDFYGYHLVATGKADIMMDAKNGPWDIAALKLIVEEAGGQVTNFEGKEWGLSDSRAVATNGIIHGKVIEILNKKE